MYFTAGTQLELLPPLFILPTFHFFRSIPGLPSENGGVFGRTTEKLNWNRFTCGKQGPF